MENKLRLSGIIRESIVDGPGIRMVVFAQGCKHNCYGCHNPSTHDLMGGYETTIDNILKAIKENPLLQGVTFSGGEPFLQAKTFAILAREIHKLNLDVLVYTGYTIEQLIDGMDENPAWRELLSEADTLVDGPFIMAQRSLSIKFRGSKNQRVIDPKASIKAKKAIEKEFTL